MVWRRFAGCIALVAEIEFQVFSGVGLLLAVAEGTIERIVGFQFVAVFLGSIFGLVCRLICRRLGHALLERLALVRIRSLDWFDANFRLGRRYWPQLRAMLAFDYVAFDRGLERAWARPRRADRTRRPRFTLGRLWSRPARSCRHRIRVEHVAASRALEGRCIVGQDPLIDPIAGVATGALNLDHSTTSHPQQKIITRQRVAHLFCPPRKPHSAAMPQSVVRCG